MKKKVKEPFEFNKKTRSVFFAGFLMIVGIFLFKIIPMKIFGNNIEFDASLHVVTAIFILYVLWHFIDQNKNFKIPFFIFSFSVIMIISIQRVAVDAHNDLGILLALLIGIISIIISRWDYFKDKFEF